MKKICAFLLITSLFSYNIVTGVQAYDIMDEKKLAVKEILVTKHELQGIKNGNTYIQSMDDMMEKLKENPEQMKKTHQKVSNAIRSLENRKYYYGDDLSSSEEKILVILEYADARMNYISIDERQKILEAEADQVNKILEKIENSDLSEVDQKEVNTAIIKIQQNLVDIAEKNMTTLLEDFEGLLQYENTGNLQASLQVNNNGDEFQGEINLIDYIIANSNFDSKYSGKIEGNSKTIVNGVENSSMNMETMFDMILKNGNAYMHISDFESKIDGEEFNDFKEIFEMLKEISLENNYISIEDPATAEVYEMINSFNPEKLFSDLNEIASQPMFTAYEKNGDTYSILPTKYACDTFKELMNIFDPFSPNQCSEKQYNDFIKDIIDMGVLSLEIGNKENTLSFLGYEQDNLEEISLNVAFDNTDINTFMINIIPDQEKYPNEKFLLDYEKNTKLNSRLYADDGEVDIVFNSTLDKNNTFTQINHNGKILGYYDSMSWNLNLENRNFDGSFKLNDDYGSIELKLNGSTNYSNQIDSFNSTLSLIENGEEILKGDFDYKDAQFEGNLILDSNYTESKTKISGSWDSQNDIFQELSIYSDFYIVGSTFDYDTYRYEYGDIQKIYDFNFGLQNEIIDGKLNVYSDTQLIFDITMDGKYKKEQLELNSKFGMYNDFNFLFGYSEQARNSKRKADIATLSLVISTFYTKNGYLPDAENLWSDLGQSGEGFTDPLGNVEIDGCKYGYTYAKGQYTFQVSTCLEGQGTEKFSRGNYYEGSDDQLGAEVYIDGYTTWEKQETDINNKNGEFNINFGFDQTSNKNNINVYIDAIYENEKIVEFNLKNTGTIEYKEIDIQAPSNTTPLEEIFEDMYQQMY